MSRLPATGQLSFLLIILSLYIYTVPVSATNVKTDGNKTLLGLKEVISSAIKNNNEIRKAEKTTSISRFNMSQACTQLLPSVSTTGMYKNAELGVKDSRNQKDINAELSANITLFDGLSTINNMKKAKYAWMATLCDEYVTRQEIKYETFSGYLQLCLDSERVKLQEENIVKQHALLFKIDAFRKAGERPVGDFLTQKAVVSSEESRLADLKNSYEADRLKLLLLIGANSNGMEILIKKPLFDSVTINLDPESDSLMSNSSKYRKEYERQNNLIKVSEFDVRLAKSAFFPILTASVGTSTSYSSLYGNLSKREQLTDNNVNNVAEIDLTIPIFDKLTKIFTVSKAKLQLEKDQIDMDELRKNIESEMRQALVAYKTACHLVELTRIELESAQQALSTAQSRYDVGALTLSELSTAISLYTTATNDNAASTYSKVMGIVNVFHSMGMIDKLIESIQQ